TCRMVSILCRYRASVHFEFLQCVWEWKRQSLVAVWIVVYSSVQQERQTIIRSSTNRNDVRRIVPRGILRSTADSSSRQNDQFGHLPSVERQLHHTHVVDDLADSGVSRFDERRVRLYFDGFRNLADFHRDVDLWICIDLQDDSGLHKHPETREACF